MDNFDPAYSDRTDNEISEAQHSNLLTAVSQLDDKQRYVLCVNFTVGILFEAHGFYVLCFKGLVWPSYYLYMALSSPNEMWEDIIGMYKLN